MGNDVSEIVFGIACFLLAGFVALVCWMGLQVIEMKGMLATALTKLEILWNDREPSGAMKRPRRNSEP